MREEDDRLLLPEEEEEKKRTSPAARAAAGLFRRRVLWIILAVVIVLAGLAAAAWSVKLTDVSYDGATLYDADTLTDLIFEEPKERRLLYALWQDKFGEHKDIPFIERYEMDFKGIHEVEITLYEKNIVGCVEYLGSYMFFDKDGIIVESSVERRENVPVVTGLTYRQIVLHKELKTQRESMFEDILNLTQLMRKYELPVDQIDFDERDQIMFRIGNVKVRLGAAEMMEGKLSELVRMLPQLEGLSGTLYLDTYNDKTPPTSYVFRKEEAEEETGQSEADTEGPENDGEPADGPEAGAGGAEEPDGAADPGAE